MNKSVQRGFTLIELIVVLTIVAILAGIAVPRFLNLQRDARIGHLQSVRGAVVSGATLVHAAMLARRGEPDAAPCPAGGGLFADNQLNGAGSVCTEGGLVQTTNGYPTAGSQGILSAAGLGTAFNPSLSELASNGYAVLINGASMTIERIDAPTPATCSFTYTEPPLTQTVPGFSPPGTAGC